MFGTAMAEVASYENRCNVTLFSNESPCVIFFIMDFH